MLWQNSQLALITLADLGERGQLRVGAEENALFESGFGKRTVIVKVAHHGSADQAPEFYDALKPDIALISVGERNSYGHPTSRCLSILEHLGTTILRTDKSGALGIEQLEQGVKLWVAGRS